MSGLELLLDNQSLQRRFIQRPGVNSGEVLGVIEPLPHGFALQARGRGGEMRLIRRIGPLGEVADQAVLLRVAMNLHHQPREVSGVGHFNALLRP